MLMKPKLIAFLLVIVTSYGCSSIDKHHYYYVEHLDGWQRQEVVTYRPPLMIGAPPLYRYGFKCDDSIYWIRPNGSTELLFAGPMIIPLIPLFITYGDGTLKFGLYSDEIGQTKNLLTFEPVIKIENHETVKPTKCSRQGTGEFEYCARQEFMIPKLEKIG